ncbi:MAG: hypothetical protein MJ078_02940, partial [Clostridia bacterium]|nr:hypothetical protein [Clostridia bacterium]
GNWNAAGNDGSVKAEPRTNANCKKTLKNSVNTIVPSYEGFTVWALNDVAGDGDSLACPENYVAVKHKGVSGTASVFAENAPTVIIVCTAVTAAGTALALTIGLKRRKKKEAAV